MANTTNLKFKEWDSNNPLLPNEAEYNSAVENIKQAEAEGNLKSFLMSSNSNIYQMVKAYNGLDIEKMKESQFEGVRELAEQYINSSAEQNVPVESLKQNKGLFTRLQESFSKMLIPIHDTIKSITEKLQGVDKRIEKVEEKQKEIEEYKLQLAPDYLSEIKESIKKELVPRIKEDMAKENKRELEEQVAAFKKGFNDSVAEFKKEISELKQDLQTANETIKKQNQTIDELKSRVTEQDKVIEKLSSKIDELVEKNKQLQKENNSNQAKIVVAQKTAKTAAELKILDGDMTRPDEIQRKIDDFKKNVQSDIDKTCKEIETKRGTNVANEIHSIASKANEQTSNEIEIKMLDVVKETTTKYINGVVLNNIHGIGQEKFLPTIIKESGNGKKPIAVIEIQLDNINNTNVFDTEHFRNNATAVAARSISECCYSAYDKIASINPFAVSDDKFIIIVEGDNDVPILENAKRAELLADFIRGDIEKQGVKEYNKIGRITSKAAITSLNPEIYKNIAYYHIEDKFIENDIKKLDILTSQISSIARSTDKTVLDKDITQAIERSNEIDAFNKNIQSRDDLINQAQLIIQQHGFEKSTDISIRLNHILDELNCTAEPITEYQEVSKLYSPLLAIPNEDIIAVSCEHRTGKGYETASAVIAQGDCKIEYNGQIYTDPVSFPDELTSKIMNNDLQNVRILEQPHFVLETSLWVLDPETQEFTYDKSITNELDISNLASYNKQCLQSRIAVQAESIVQEYEKGLNKELVSEKTIQNEISVDNVKLVKSNELSEMEIKGGVKENTYFQSKRYFDEVYNREGVASLESRFRDNAPLPSPTAQNSIESKITKNNMNHLDKD